MVQSVRDFINGGLSNTADEPHAPVIPALVYRCGQRLPTIFGKHFGGQVNGSEWLQFLLKTLSDWLLKEFVSGVDWYEDHLFSSRSFTRPQDHLLQRMMGIDVRVEEGVEVVHSCENYLSSGRLVPAHATRIFTPLCRYRLVDIIALLEGTHPSATVVERIPAPTGTLQACAFSALYCKELIFGLSVSLI